MFIKSFAVFKNRGIPQKRCYLFFTVSNWKIPGFPGNPKKNPKMKKCPKIKKKLKKSFKKSRWPSVWNRTNFFYIFQAFLRLFSTRMCRGKFSSFSALGRHFPLIPSQAKLFVQSGTRLAMHENTANCPTHLSPLKWNNMRWGHYSTRPGAKSSPRKLILYP